MSNGEADTQLDLFQSHLHPATQDVLAQIEAASHPAELRGIAPQIGRTLLENKAPTEEYDIAFGALKDRKQSFRASPEAIAAAEPPDIAPDPVRRPLSRTRPTTSSADEAPRPRDFRERQFKD